ncbi:MAG: hypothetical protein Q9195_008620 [Heterodermia aff. obscurata]
MNSPAIAKVFQQLFAHQTCSRRIRTSSVPRSITAHRRKYHGNSSEETYMDDGSMQSNWQQRTAFFPPDKLKDFERYPTTDANALRKRKERPRRVKMLMRDFIEDSLYNPNYGYFPQQAVIFNPGEPFDFNSLPDEATFQKVLGERYTEFEDTLDEHSPSDTRQLWHTPTELFRPHYGEAIAQYLVTNYKLLHHPFHDLVIYELGAGNGTLMMNILDFIRDCYPEVYDRTKFKVIEISPALVTLQTAQLNANAESRGHKDHVEIINQSIFSWDNYIASPCYFLSLEVFDNFAHDSIRYDPITEQPLQGSVLIDKAGDFYEFYSQDIDPVASRFLRVRYEAVSKPFDHPVSESRWKRSIKARLPFAANLTVPEFIPTRLMQFFDILQSYFPQHHLVASDFNALPDAIPGFNAPVVQTRYQRRVVPVTTPLVHQGYFDILFPTDFSVMEDIYRAMTGRLSRVSSHEDFLRRWSDVEATQCKNGVSPMLTWYKNASVLTTV